VNPEKVMFHFSGIKGVWYVHEKFHFSGYLFIAQYALVFNPVPDTSMHEGCSLE